MVVTAKMVVGRLGALELAAAGISTDLAYQMCIVLMGLFSVVGVLVSEAFEPGAPGAIGEVLEVIYVNDHLGLRAPAASDHGIVLARLLLYGTQV